MSRYHSHINSAKQVLKEYSGNEPFASFLKKFFARDKRYGSKDRKLISHLCYCFFRLGKSLQALAMEERILAGAFLCSQPVNEAVLALRPEWSGASVDEKITSLHSSRIDFDIREVFPFESETSNRLDLEAFNHSMLVQPDLFLRVRPGKLMPELPGARHVSHDCVALPNGTRIEEFIAIDRDAVVQDYSSQRISEFLKELRPADNRRLGVWDCCCASGGKAILAKDVLTNVNLTVSDIRESILHNLRARFQRAGITDYKSFVKDLTANSKENSTGRFDLVICDAPCSGSGTWSRTPEQLFYFDINSVDRYQQLQKKIVNAAAAQVNAGGHFLYITCSVFKKENEEIVEHIHHTTSLRLVRAELLTGYHHKADTLFGALFSA